MGRDGVVYLYNGILLSHKKEWNWVIYRDLDGPRNCHTEWNKSEREKQISYNIMQDLEKWYRWTYLQSWNRDRHREQTCGYQREKGTVGWIERLGLTYIHYCIKQITN